MIDNIAPDLERMPTDFDRMIAQVERQAAERAWLAGYAAGFARQHVANPYRKEARND
jgi:hypothetical protein